MMVLKVVTVFLLGIVLVVLAIDDWTAHCDKCKCKWASGKKLADCKNLSLVEVPTTLSTEVREIDFSFNPFYELKAREFSTANLNNVHKLRFQNCSIGDINFTAFEGISLLIELDLSYNNINKLSPKVFHSNDKLRIINLSYNNLTKLEPGLFENMTHLQRVLLNNNALVSISSEAFGSNCTVHNIELRYNNLQTVDGNFLDNFPRISSLDLVGNPWVCDCQLEKFRTVSVSKNLITSTTLCKEPERLREEAWDNPKIIFACVPEILEIVSSTLPVEISTNYTVSCKVRGSPDPDINWLSNNRIIDRDPRQNVQKYVTSKNQVGDLIWYNLTIININYRDRGEYKCVAKNPGGNAEGNVTLSVRVGGDGDGSLYVMSSSNPLAWIIGLSVGAFILLVVIFILICYCCRRSSRDNNIMSKNRRLSQSNEFINLDGHPNDMDKSLITEVNPILKPPRQHSVPQSINSGGTEVSETKKMLMDNDSMYDDDSRSLELDSRYPPKTSNHRIDYRGETHYPPDLLSFPPHAIPQVSPAGSSASTVADTSRLPAHHGPQSPLHSPMYDNTMYRTLPYSRSHSPFTSPHSGLPVRVPRQGGYVTIPRRPRQSWSSEPPPSSETGGEPLYDNLGLRTTATGSSVLSLNRIGDNPSTPKASTPMKPMYPLSPNLVSLPCDPIAEQESPPTVAATLPRSISAQRALSPNADLMRANWTRSPELVDSRRESTASLLPTPDGKTPKIPPRPPPKPKKRASTGPLFEDEGEDGTEV